MNVGVFGTGVVGRTIASRLVELGHQVALGTRDPDQGPGAGRARLWLNTVGTARGARLGSYAEVAAHGALLVNATAGAGSLAALRQAGDRFVHGKVLIDVANPVEFEPGLGPLLSVVNDDSLGEQLQRSFPDTRVVKTLNMVNAEVMVHPDRLPEETTMLIAGNDPEAKATVADLLRAFGWRAILDLGPIRASRGMEMYHSLWQALQAAQSTPNFNLRIVRG